MGSEFIIRLPTAAPEVIGAPVPPTDDKSSTPARARRVLVVDDNVHAAQSLAVILELWGHDVQVTHDGSSALDLVPDYRPEVILLDIGLPEMNGYQVADRIREDPTLARTAIVAMTGYASDDDRQRSMAAGFRDHLVKPLDLDLLERFLGDLN